MPKLPISEAVPGDVAKAIRQDARKRYLIDLAERFGKTFVQAFLMVVTAPGILDVDVLSDVSILRKALMAGLAAVYSLGMNLLAGWAGTPYSAAALTAKADPHNRVASC